MSENPVPETLETIAAKIDALGRSMAERFDAVDERFVGMDERFTTVDERLTTVDERLTQGDDSTTTTYAFSPSRSQARRSPRSDRAASGYGATMRSLGKYD